MMILALTLLAQALTGQNDSDLSCLRFNAETIVDEWWTQHAELVERPDGNKGLRIHVPDEGQTWPWHSGAVSPEGLFEGGKAYRIIVSFEPKALPDSKSGFYLFVRSDALGYGVDRWIQWRGEPNSPDEVSFPISLPQADDFRIHLGVHFSGTVVIDSITIEEGSGWKSWTDNELVDSPPDSLPEIRGPEPFTVDTPHVVDAPVFCVSDFGAISREEGGLPSDAPERNFEAFQAAFDAAPKSGGAIVRVPPGTYDFPARGSVVIHDFEDLLFDGCGSLFVYGTAERPMAFDVQRLHRAELRDFRVDWDWDVHALAYYGYVTDAASDGSWFDIEFHDEPELDPEDIWWNGMANIDPDTGIYQAGPQIGAFEVESIGKTGPGAFHVVPESPQTIRAGETYLVRNYTYNRFVIDMRDNVHLTLRDITIHSFPGMGFYVNGDQQYWRLIDCRIAHPEGELRPITCTTDGYHVARSKGYSIIDGAEFGGCGDDGINIHDNNSLGVRIVDTHTVIAENIVWWRNEYEEGDLIEFRNGDLSPTGFQSVLTAVEYDRDREEALMRFEDPVPQDLPHDAILFNRRYDSSHFVIRNSRFFDNWTRGVLIHASHGLVENNVFENNRHEAMRIETGWESRWGEGYTVENLVIRNNTVINPNAYGPSEGAAVHMGVYLPSGPTSYPVFRNVLFEGNTVKGAPGPAFRIGSFADVVFRNNRIEGVSPWISCDSYGGVIRASHGEGLYAVGNTWSDTPSTVLLQVDPDTTIRVYVGDGPIEE